MKKIIIGLVIITAIVLWYFFAPIGWTFGTRMPKNYNECVNAGGAINKENHSLLPISECTYKSKFYIKDIM